MATGDDTVFVNPPLRKAPHSVYLRKGGLEGKGQVNNLYFACRDCKTYIDAGYRWAYWQLEEAGIVVRGEEVNVEAVLAARDYWNPPQDGNSRWLCEEVFPPLRKFLHDHKSHQVVFGEEDDFAPPGDEYFDWMQVGYQPIPTPRYLVDVLGIKSWEQVHEYMEKQKTPPPWWEVTWLGDPSPQEKGRQKFEELVRKKHGM